MANKNFLNNQNYLTSKREKNKISLFIITRNRYKDEDEDEGKININSIDLKISKFWQKIIFLFPVFAIIFIHSENNLTLENIFISLIIMYVFMGIFYYRLIYKAHKYKIYKTNKHFYYYKKK